MIRAPLGGGVSTACSLSIVEGYLVCRYHGIGTNGRSFAPGHSADENFCANSAGSGRSDLHVRISSGRIGGSSRIVTTKKKTTEKRGTAPRHREHHVQLRNQPLRDLTGEALRIYFLNLNGHKPGQLYDLVMGEVEPPLFEAVLDYTNGNQSRAAEILGLNRATLRKKLRQYELLD